MKIDFHETSINNVIGRMKGLTPQRQTTRMKLLTKAIRDQMIANGKAQDAVRGTETEIDFKPVVKLFNPYGTGIRLLAELDSRDPELDTAFGLCDLGMGFPELGCVHISELQNLRLGSGLGIERDLYWKPKTTLRGYAQEAQTLGRINA